MELVKDLKTKNTDYMIIRSIIGKKRMSLNVVRSLCYKAGVKESLNKINFLIGCGQVIKDENDRYVLVENQSTPHYSLMGIDELVSSSLNRMPVKRISLESILEGVSLFYGYSIPEIKSACRKREYVVCRQNFCHIAKAVIPHITLKGIGRLLNNRDHSTIIHSIQTAGNFLTYDKKYKQDYDELLRFVTARV
tara:strand:+ start:145 stop:723 length:579 start_codon:yes stop_codon:yes gene_type:complete